MIISVLEVRSKFDALVNGSKSREEIAKFAITALRADDERNLQFDPRTERSRIWKAIVYLTGVDLMSAPGQYLHCVDDFIDFREKNDF